MRQRNYNPPLLVALAALSLLNVQAISAKCGSVDYSWGADGLAEATSFLGTMMIYTVDVIYAGAVLISIIGALQICIKINYHEGDITKSVLMLFGGIVFIIGASIVMPALYGYQDMTFVF